jgi:hypothetical protein
MPAIDNDIRRKVPPAVAFAADQPVGRQEYTIEHHLVEVVVAGEVDDRPDRNTRRLEIKDQLAEPGMAVVLGRGDAHEGDREMRFMRIARPHLGAGDLVPARDRNCAGADRRQV